MLISDNSAIAGQLTQAKTSLEAQELRDQITTLNQQLDKYKRKLKAEKSLSRRLRRRLDQINPKPKEEEHHDND